MKVGKNSLAVLLMVVVGVMWLIVGCSTSAPSQPTAQPATQPTAKPAAPPTAQPAAKPAAQPTAQPAAKAAPPDYPKKAISIIVPTTAGGGYDLGARLIAQYLPKYLPNNANAVVENRSGAAQIIGVQALYTAEPDGYTIGAFNAVGALVNQATRSSDVKFDTSKFMYLGLWQQDTRAVGVSADLNVKTWGDLVAMSQKEPIICGTGGLGTSQHIDPMMMETVSDLKLRYIHYDGSANADLGMLRKEIQMEVAQVSTLQQLADQKAGRPFFVIAEKRMPSAPDVPTALEVGMPKDMYDKLTTIPYFGVDRVLAAPPGTDPGIVELLRSAAWKVFQDPQYQAAVVKMQGENNAMQGKDYDAILAKKIKAAQENKDLAARMKF
jgi:tripartite-type tricarboxylate transporter receptor subunit TctC